MVLKFKRLTYSLLAIFAGLFILMISLGKTASATALSEDGTSSQKQFYLNEPIKPDHVLYPALAAKERLDFVLLSPEEKTKKQIEIADQRLNDGVSLLEKEQKDLAAVTIIKAEEYLFQAAVDIGRDNLSDDSRQLVIKALKEHKKVIVALMEKCPAHLQPKLNEVIQKQTAVVTDLEK